MLELREHLKRNRELRQVVHMYRHKLQSVFTKYSSRNNKLASRDLRKKLTVQIFSELVQGTGLARAADLTPKSIALIFAQSQSEDFSNFEGAAR